MSFDSYICGENAAIRSRQPVVEENGFEVSVLDITNPDDAALAMRNIGVTGTGSTIMKNNTVNRVLRVNNITTTTEALIIKQEILARGEDAALERDAVSHETEETDVIVMGTFLQVRKLTDKLECQARNLPLISKMIKEALKQESDVEYCYLR
ncbi:hypothetical protein [Methanococcoides sp.]|uniref:hypothetical protein n=1 Tax=Methanococcoides sp. TaxID=1966350 RepID=UPI00272EB2B3|nr:hypothetical protein [Methanococcoides sp.]